MHSVDIHEAKTHLSALLADIEAGEDLIICRGPEPIACVTRIHRGAEVGNLRAVLRGERSKQRPVTSQEILAWRREGRIR